MKQLALLLLALLAPAGAQAQQITIPPQAGVAIVGCVYNSAAPTIVTGTPWMLQCDVNGNLLTTGGGGGGGTVTQGNAGTNAQAWWMRIGDATRGPVKVQAGNASAAADVALTVTDPNVLAAVQSPIPLGTTTGGWTPLKLAALTNTAVAIKASGGWLGKLYCWNPNATVAYIQVYNVAAGSVTVGTTAALQSYGIPPTNSAGFVMNAVGDEYGTAISAAATTTAGGGTAPGTAVDCNVSYN